MGLESGGVWNGKEGGGGARRGDVRGVEVNSRKVKSC